MGRRLFRGFHGKALCALTMGCLLVPVSLAQERQKVLDLNNLTGKDVIKAVVLSMTPSAPETKKLLAEALKIAREKEQPLNYNAGIILGKLATEANDLAAAEVFYRISMNEAAKLQSFKRLLESYGGLIDAYYDNKKYADAGRICKELLDLKTDDGKQRLVLRLVKDNDDELDFIKEDSFDTARRLRPSVKRIYVLALAKQKKYDQALKLVDEIVKERGNHWLDYELKGRVLHEAGRDEEAVKVFEDVIDRVAKDADLTDKEREEFLEQYRYSLSSLLIDINQIDKAADILQKLIENSPDNPSYYNDLGYIWADKNVRLNEAEKLIRKALDLARAQRKANPELGDRDSGAYLDSLGWVLYRQKRYKEAREVLEKAVEDKSAQHIEIYDHLGDACRALGDRQGALEAWRKGLQSASESRRDQDRKAAVEKKLEQLK